MAFKDEIAPYAQAQGQLYGIFPAFIMGVACLESAFGASGLAKDANNLFGIKGNYQGKSVTMPTTEYINGTPQKVNAEFRKYPSFNESIKDFCELMKHGVNWDPQKYSRAVIGKTDLHQVIYNFSKSGYMTDPAYYGKLLGVIKSQNLEVYNTIPKHEEKHPIFLSLVDFLKSQGKDSSYPGRAILAKEHGINNYTGTQEQNIKLLQLLGGQ